MGTMSATSVNYGKLVAYQHHQTTFTFTIVDSEGEAVDLSSKTVKFKAYNRPDETTAFQRATGGTGVTVSGSGGNVVAVVVTGTNTATAKTYGFVLVNDTDDEMLSYGTLTVQEGADVTMPLLCRLGFHKYRRSKVPAAMRDSFDADEMTILSWRCVRKGCNTFRLRGIWRWKD